MDTPSTLNAAILRWFNNTHQLTLDEYEQLKKYTTFCMNRY